MELNENELENVLGGAKREVVNDKVEEIVIYIEEKQ